MHGTLYCGRDPPSQASNPTMLSGGVFPPPRGTKNRTPDLHIVGPAYAGSRWPLSQDPVVYNFIKDKS
ncbi:hypothetical protein HanIR_Chr06g0263351 [Helianthus annuus]|nr:hypothetical protein HanIR_Chr06g0263351 [Helianthus annuus]